MTDVFLSYSQAAPEPTVALAADLGQAGYAVWYDTKLLSNDVFWRVIMKRITDARAVIVIWSPRAVESDWVYGEAKLAHEQKKLICVRTEDVAPGAVPLPFNGYNVSPLVDRAKIMETLAAMKVPQAATVVAPFAHSMPVTASPLVNADRAAGEIALAWSEIKASDDPEDFAAFLAHYGEEHAFFARLAKKRVALLRGTAPVVLVPAGRAEVIAIAPPTPAAREEIAAAAGDVTLRIDPGMHTATIRRISVSKDGRLLATGSDDKTVRLWALPEGRLIRTLRPTIGDGNDGKVYAVTLAPHGRWVAAGGWSQSEGRHYVSIFDTTTGAILARLGPLPNVINDLEVAPDGSRLAAGLGGANGIRVWECSPSPRPSRGEGWGEGQPQALPAQGSAPHPNPLPALRGEGMSWPLAFEDQDYGDQVYGLSFAPDGRLASTSFDGHVRLHAPTGTRLARMKAPGGVRPFGIAVSPDGTRIAIGYDDTMRVDVLDGQALAPLFAADTSGIDNSDLGSVAWFDGGARLVAAGRQYAGGESPTLVWDQGGRGRRSVWPGATDTVMDLAPLPDSNLVLGASDPSFSVLDSTGRLVLRRGPALPDLRDKRAEHFLVSADGRRVRFGLEPFSASPVVLDLAGPSLAASPSPPARFLQADTKSLPIDGWINTTAPTLAGTPLPLMTYEKARSLAILPGGAGFFLGTEWRLRCFDVAVSGGFLRKKKYAATQAWENRVPGTVWGVNLARDGRLVVAAYGDGTIRWHRADDGTELLAATVHVDRTGGEARPIGWVIWTPAGYYTCSPGAEDLIGWHVNRGPDQAADFYPAAEFARTFHKPEIVAKALDGV